MMGTDCKDDQAFLAKTNNGLLVFTAKEANAMACLLYTSRCV